MTTSEHYRVYNADRFSQEPRPAALKRRHVTETYSPTPGVEVTARDLDAEPQPPTMYGHFARFGVWNQIGTGRGSFLERIDPGAFTETFERDGANIKPILDHGQDPQLGMKPLGEVRTLTTDDIGPYYEVDLFKSVPELVLDGLTAGAYGASYRFRVDDDDLTVDKRPGESDHNPRGLPEVTINRAQVIEFGPTAFGADPGATSGVRSMNDRFLNDVAEFGRVLGVDETPSLTETERSVLANRARRLRALSLRNQR